MEKVNCQREIEIYFNCKFNKTFGYCPKNHDYRYSLQIESMMTLELPNDGMFKHFN